MTRFFHHKLQQFKALEQLSCAVVKSDKYHIGTKVPRWDSGLPHRALRLNLTWLQKVNLRIDQSAKLPNYVQTHKLRGHARHNEELAKPMEPDIKSIWQIYLPTLRGNEKENYEIEEESKTHSFNRIRGSRKWPSQANSALTFQVLPTQNKFLFLFEKPVMLYWQASPPTCIHKL